MPDYPPGVEPAVRDAIAAKLPVGTSWNTDVTSLARAALDAAAPLLAESVAEAERERIRQLASLVSASYFVGTDEHGPDIRQFADLIGEGDERIQPRRAS